MKNIKAFNLSTSKQKTAIDFETLQFPSGAWHFRITSAVQKSVQLIAQLQNGEAFMQLFLITDALKRAGAENIHLYLPFVPYARQDRVIMEGEPLSIAVIAQLINSQNYKQVEIFDPHSDVAAALIHNVKIMETSTFLKWVQNQIPADFKVVSPDAGAQKRTIKAATILNKTELVFCSKVRDLKTGSLKAFKVFSEDLKGKPCLIVDDICDGGGTFLGIAEALKAKGAGDLYLAVSHGIFSKGFEQLHQYFKIIFTTSAYDSGFKNNDFLKIFEL